MNRTLENKAAVVTGGSRGIGRAIVEAFSAHGARVLTCARSGDGTDLPGGVHWMTADVSRSADIDALAVQALDMLGQIDILVNSAGLNLAHRRYHQMSVEDWQRVIAANLNGAFYCTHAVLPGMRERRDGLIINISSWAGRYDSYIAGPAYGASKHGLSSMSATLNLEEGRYGIRCCCVEPAEVATEILDQRPVPVSEVDRQRMLQVEDLGETIRFVAEMPAHVCLNEIVISPTWNRAHMGDEDQYPGPP